MLIDQAPADDRADDDDRDGPELDVPVPARGAVEVGLGVVAAAPQDVGQHDAAPRGDRHAEGDQEPLELAEEVVGDENDVDRARDHEHAVDQGGDVARDPQAGASSARPEE